MRTFSRAQWEEADAAWSDFSPEWTPFRDLARQRGMLYPPSGSRWDSPEDAQPSQRAIVVRAIRDTPKALRRVIAASTSWSQVVARLVEAMARLREQVGVDEQVVEAERAEVRQQRRQAPERLGDIIARSARPAR